jgi:hypothetical protein
VAERLPGGDAFPWTVLQTLGQQVETARPRELICGISAAVFTHHHSQALRAELRERRREVLERRHTGPQGFGRGAEDAECSEDLVDLAAAGE